MIKQTTCCDFLLVNDTQQKAYFIELKGGNIDDAVDQLEAAEKKCRAELAGYAFFYRIVCSKARMYISIPVNRLHGHLEPLLR